MPAVRHIENGLRVLLVNGALSPGTELLSFRHVGLELGAHFNTVAEAYRQLAAEGWLEQKHGTCAVVIKRRAPGASGKRPA